MSKQIFFPSNPKLNINKIFRNNTEIDDDIKSFLNISEDSSQSKGYDIYEPSLDRVLPIFFEDDNKEKTKEKSNEIGYPCQQDNQENQENQEKKKIIDVDFIEKVQQKIKENIYLIRPFKEKKKIGRKIRSKEGSGEHNKFSNDNLTRKCKHLVLDSIWNFINQKIKIMYSDESDEFPNNLKMKQLLKLGQKSAERSKVEYNKEFLNKTLGSIFSEDVSTKYSRYSINHNKNLIEDLLNENDEKKRLIFQKLFGLTFLDCLNYYRGIIDIEELYGMKKFDEYLNETDLGYNSDEYEKVIKCFMYNYEKIIKGKHSRTRVKKIKNNK
jgi:hypothetical protein